METLSGARNFNAAFENGSTRELSIGQIKLRKYEAALAAKDKGEIDFVAVVAGMTKEEVYDLTPDSYETILRIIREVNAGGFFVYSARRQKEMLDRMNSMTPEALKAAVEVSKASPALSLGLQPKRE